MRLLKEALFYFFVVAVALSFYSLAAGAALFSRCGFFSHRDEPEILHHFPIAANANLRNKAHITGELQ